jgi:hypothetical protein
MLTAAFVVNKHIILVIILLSVIALTTARRGVPRTIFPSHSVIKSLLSSETVMVSQMTLVLFVQMETLVIILATNLKFSAPALLVMDMFTQQLLLLDLQQQQSPQQRQQKHQLKHHHLHLLHLLLVLLKLRNRHKHPLQQLLLLGSQLVSVVVQM